MSDKPMSIAALVIVLLQEQSKLEMDIMRFCKEEGLDDYELVNNILTINRSSEKDMRQSFEYIKELHYKR